MEPKFRVRISCYRVTEKADRHLKYFSIIKKNPGLAHIAFAVDDVDSAIKEVIGAGGRAIGKLTSLKVAGAGTVTVVYMADPEGNIIELQRWSQE